MPVDQSLLPAMQYDIWTHYNEMPNKCIDMTVPDRLRFISKNQIKAETHFWVFDPESSVRVLATLHIEMDGEKKKHTASIHWGRQERVSV